MYRIRPGELEIFLGHSGGPYWTGKDDGAWSIPKGEFDHSEDAQTAARREFREETGFAIAGELLPLIPRRQKGGKLVIAFAIEGDCDATLAKSNLFEMEWPPHSGRMQSFPEMDRAAWFDLTQARRKIMPGQVPFLDELEALLAK